MPTTARCYYRSFHGSAVSYTNEVKTWSRDRRNWTVWKVYHTSRTVQIIDVVESRPVVREIKINN